MVQLDNSLDNGYASHLLSGMSLPINFSTFTFSSQVFTNFHTHVDVQRSCTRLKAVFVSLTRRDSDASPSLNEANYFWHPIGGENYNHKQELEFHMQIGSKLFPEYPIRSLAEAFYQSVKHLVSIQPLFTWLWNNVITCLTNSLSGLILKKWPVLHSQDTIPKPEIYLLWSSNQHFQMMRWFWALPKHTKCFMRFSTMRFCKFRIRV